MVVLRFPILQISIAILGEKSVKLMRPRLYAYIATKEEKDKWWGELFQLLADKKLNIKIYKTYKLEDATTAHIDIESRKTVGKLLLEL